MASFPFPRARRAAALSLGGISGLFAALLFGAAAFAAPQPLYEAHCKTRQGAAQNFFIAAEALNPTAYLLRFTASDAKTGGLRTLGRKVLNADQIKAISFDRRFAVQSGGKSAEMQFVRGDTANIYLKSGQFRQNYQNCALYYVFQPPQKIKARPAPGKAAKAAERPFPPAPHKARPAKQLKKAKARPHRQADKRLKTAKQTSRASRGKHGR